MPGEFREQLCLCLASLLFISISRWVTTMEASVWWDGAVAILKSLLCPVIEVAWDRVT